MTFCGFEELVEQKEVSFPDIAKIYAEQLVKGEIEGVIINFGEEVVKWKGATEEQHQHLKEIEDAKTLVDTETYESWKAIAVASKIFEEKENSKKSNPKPISPAEALLQTAYRSALTKMMTLEEHLESGQKVEDYMKELRKEMMNDRPENQKEGPAYEKKLPSFIFNQLKEYIGDRDGSEIVVKTMGVQMKEWMNKKKSPK